MLKDPPTDPDQIYSDSSDDDKTDIADIKILTDKPSGIYIKYFD